MAERKADGDGDAGWMLDSLEQELAAIRANVARGQQVGARPAASSQGATPARAASRVIDPRPINMNRQDLRRSQAQGQRRTLAERLADVKPED